MIQGESQQEFASPEAALKHYGKKGMRWGVRNEDQPIGRDATGRVPVSSKPVGRDATGRIPVSSKSVKAADYHRLAGKIVEQSGVDPHLAAAKYGPPAMMGAAQKQHQADREKLKKVAIGLGIGVGVAGLGIAAYKLNQSGFDLDALPSDQKKFYELIKTSNKAYRNPADGLGINWEHGVDLPKGSVLRRLSSVAETNPRPGGFFAAHLESDVESYKAILPAFWEQWGVGRAESGGFINHYQAKEGIRAPSGKESFAIFKKLVDTDDTFNSHFASFWDTNGARGKSEDQLKRLFMDSSANWVDSDNAYTKQWFAAIKSNGYNSVIDFNDAGKLSKTPLRIIDGELFDIVKNEPQSLNDFYTAAKKWSPELVHIFTLETGELVFIHVDEFLTTIKLEHAGVSSGKIDLKKTSVQDERR